MTCSHYPRKKKATTNEISWTKAGNARLLDEASLFYTQRYPWIWISNRRREGGGGEWDKKNKKRGSPLKGGRLHKEEERCVASELEPCMYLRSAPLFYGQFPCKYLKIRTWKKKLVLVKFVRSKVLDGSQRKTPRPGHAKLSPDDNLFRRLCSLSPSLPICPTISVADAREFFYRLDSLQGETYFTRSPTSFKREREKRKRRKELASKKSSFLFSP